MKKIIASLFILTLSYAAFSVSRFTDNGDGTVKDNGTGLIWQKCSMGQTYSGGTCTGEATDDPWKSSLAYCAGLTLAGRSWRLPNVNELKSLVDISKSGSPSIHRGFFPNTKRGVYFTSSPAAGYTNCVWAINFDDGGRMWVGGKTGNYARCVTGP